MNEHAPPDPGDLMQLPCFAFRHVVSFQETNVVGNVYFVHHLAWQGRCRELFLKEHAPEVLAELGNDLRLVTLRASCDYLDELLALDEVEIRMRLAHLRAHRIGLEFECVRASGDAGAVVAVGFQEIACMRLQQGRLTPAAPPAALARALRAFGSQDAGWEDPCRGAVARCPTTGGGAAQRTGGRDDLAG